MNPEDGSIPYQSPEASDPCNAWERFDNLLSWLSLSWGLKMLAYYPGLPRAAGAPKRAIICNALPGELVPMSRTVEHRVSSGGGGLLMSSTLVLEKVGNAHSR
jgi:hypothetical protein